MKQLSDIEIARERAAPAGGADRRRARFSGGRDRVLRPLQGQGGPVGGRAAQDRPDGKLVLGAGVTPPPRGGGDHDDGGAGGRPAPPGEEAVLALREPSLGPVFGIKGGAAGGGWAQVIPMEDINLHFTGDMHAIGAANNLLAAMLDNHIHQGNGLGIDVRRITWKRCVDMNDRQLRQVVDGLGGRMSVCPGRMGSISPWPPEIMAILCLSSGIRDLRSGWRGSWWATRGTTAR